jgi:hypothetical protein
LQSEHRDLRRTLPTRGGVAIPPRRCCCVDCFLGADEFDRADANPPTGRWHEISGEFEIVDETVSSITPGVLATTICHLPIHDEGSFIANFQLVGLRTRTIYKVRAGNPSTSDYEVHFEPLDMDLVTARIRVTAYGDAGETAVVEHPWPVDVMGDSEDITEAFICYQPGVHLKGSIGSFGGLPPVPGVCVTDPGSHCWDIGGTDVGNFSFVEGTFDNWDYQVTQTDDLTCNPCGCFCLRGQMPTDRYTPDKACFPETIKAIFQLVSSSVYAGACPLNDFEVDMTELDADRTEWISAEQTVCGTSFRIKANCESFDSEGIAFRGLTLTLLDGLGFPSTVVFQWQDPDFAGGESASTRFPDYEESTCDPLGLVYNNLLLSCAFGPCGPPEPPGTMGHIPLCCNSLCLPTCPTILYKVTLVVG